MLGLMLVGGLVLLIAGGGGLVSGAVALARRLGLSAGVVGAVVLGFGTSVPELSVSLRAALAGSPDIALGNVVGSNTANILLILGLSALLGGMLRVSPGERTDIAIGLAAGVALLAAALTGEVGRLAGLVALAGLAGYLALALRREAEPDDGSARPRLGVALVKLGAGLAGVLIGADLLVRGAVGLSEAAGLSEAVIGLTIVAVGTSLPELATSIAAARRGQAALAVGNVVGSNIFNLLGILGATAVIAPVAAAPRFAALDIPVMLAAMLVLLLLARRGIGRRAGVALLAGYAGYLVLMQVP
ncbi:calcium/sodium antiporter [Pontivivens ytuae]|uniref:Calcium/sodium antiporter n=1 Tax=Pontivivens ytuae TaxID=2789856 RepID=A0A7S9LR77_9RHOB|nr:calcium/sodium antiporter [Pontivivens ytuae]QPH53821.1 calcium/sodium antiporter [Pontivivens ytuae]